MEPTPSAGAVAMAPGDLVPSAWALLDPADGVGLAAAVASRRGLELHAVALLQSPEPVHLDRAVVDEDVGPPSVAMKPKPFSELNHLTVP